MAKVKKERKLQSKAGPTRRTYLNNIASGGSSRGGGVNRMQYLKYSDVPRKRIHTGTATFRDNDILDDPSSELEAYSRAVKRGHEKSYFRFQNKLYKILNSSGTSYEEIKV